MQSWALRCDILILIFHPLYKNLCYVLPQPATSNRLVIIIGLLAVFSQNTELCSSLFIFFKGKKKGKWLNAILFIGDVVLPKWKDLCPFQETFKLRSQDLLLGACVWQLDLLCLCKSYRKYFQTTDYHRNSWLVKKQEQLAWGKQLLIHKSGIITASSS